MPGGKASLAVEVEGGEGAGPSVFIRGFVCFIYNTENIDGGSVNLRAHETC